MQTLPNGVDTPTNSDPYNLTDDLAAAFMSASTVVPVASPTARDAYRDSRPGKVSIVCRTDLTGLPLEIWDGSSNWHRYSRSYAKAVGTAPIGVVNANSLSGPFWQSFPAGRFSVPPVVIVTTDQSRIISVPGGITKDGFNLYLQNVAGSASNNGSVYWSAEQMTSTSATG